MFAPILYSPTAAVREAPNNHWLLIEGAQDSWDSRSQREVGLPFLLLSSLLEEFLRHPQRPEAHW